MRRIKTTAQNGKKKMGFVFQKFGKF